MEAVKAMIAILLAAAVEFTAVVIYNNKSEPAYEAKIIRANMAGTVEIVKQAAIGKSSKASAVAAYQKNKNSNL
jgi:uncharacterized protein YktA (UPF0223 family)